MPALLAAMRIDTERIVALRRADGSGAILRSSVLQTGAIWAVSVAYLRQSCAIPEYVRRHLVAIGGSADHLAPCLDPAWDTLSPFGGAAGPPAGNHTLGVKVWSRVYIFILWRSTYEQYTLDHTLTSQSMNFAPAPERGLGGGQSMFNTCRRF